MRNIILFATTLLFLTSCDLPKSKLEDLMEGYNRYLVSLSIREQVLNNQEIDSILVYSEKEVSERKSRISELIYNASLIEEGSLEASDAVALKTLKWSLDVEKGQLDFFWHHFVTSTISFNFDTPYYDMTNFPLRNKEDVRKYGKAISLYGRHLEGLLGYLQKQVSLGIVIPQSSLKQTINFFKAMVREGTQSSFNLEFSNIEGVNKEAARSEWARKIDAEINPRLENILGYLTNNYPVRSDDAPGAFGLPDGANFYKHMLRYHLSMSGADPESLHEQALTEISRLMELEPKLREKTGFKGSREEMLHFIKTDPRFFAKTEKEYKDRLGQFFSISERIKGEFFSLPRSPLKIERMAPESEEGITFGYYDPPTEARPYGVFFFNGSHLDTQNLLFAETFFYHEGLPGHHFQYASFFENPNLHPVQRKLWFCGPQEGWAEYAAHDMSLRNGGFQDPYSAYYELWDDIFMTARIVVDTGFHHYGWSMEKAKKLLTPYSIKNEALVDSELRRYSVDMPAQGICYKGGRMKINEIIEKRREAQGSRFDIREFHRDFLSHGQIPFSVLSEM